MSKMNTRVSTDSGKIDIIVSNMRQTQGFAPKLRTIVLKQKSRYGCHRTIGVLPAYKASG